MAGPATARTRYFFAFDLRNCVGLLPRLMGSIVEVIRFLGPEHCALSVVEGNSPDGTGEVLAALRPRLTALGVRTHMVLSSTADPLPRGEQDEPTVLFINDVAICPDDVLELAY